MLRDVQSFNLFRFRYTNAGNHVCYFQEDNGADQRKAPGDQYAHKLVAKLSPVTIHTADGLACAENWIDHLLGENAGQESANRATCAVNSKSIQSIIISEDRFYLRNHV